MRYDLNKIPLQVARTTSYQDYLDRDGVTAPAHYREQGDNMVSGPPIGPERYTSRAFYERERVIWDKAWQVACRVEHIPNVGDCHVYDICNRSYLVIRTAPDEIRAYPNACLHRGRKLRTHSGNVAQLKCPFHGFAWGLNGSLQNLPCQWDFPGVSPQDLTLPEVQTGVWAGWVFINADPNAIALADYLDPIARHYESYLWEQSYLGIHVGKVLRGNWKVVQEAFLESFHSLHTHPQILGYTDDIGTQYDCWADKPHVSRMIVPFASPSQYVKDQLSEQEVFDEFRKRSKARSGNVAETTLGPKETARMVAAREGRANVQIATGGDLSGAADAEFVDGSYYAVFPNLMQFGGYGPNPWYRFRPYNDDHETTLMEIGFLRRHHPDEPKPRAAPLRLLDVDEPWASIPEFSDLGPVFDQDTANMALVQEGLKATFQSEILLADYQESRIRHFHATLDMYMSLGRSST